MTNANPNPLVRVRRFTGTLQAGQRVVRSAEFQTKNIWPLADEWLAGVLAEIRTHAPRADAPIYTAENLVLFWRVEWADDHFCEAETPLAVFDDPVLDEALFGWERGTLAAQVRAIVLDRAEASGYPESPDLAAEFLSEREVGG